MPLAPSSVAPLGSPNALIALKRSGLGKNPHGIGPKESPFSFEQEVDPHVFQGAPHLHLLRSSWPVMVP